MMVNYRKPSKYDRDDKMNKYGFNIKTKRFFSTYNKDLNYEYLNFLVELTNTLDNYNIDYILIYGTLLGCYRHGGYIPTDDDIDIAINLKDHKKLLNIETDMFTIINGFYPICPYYNSINDYYNKVKGSKKSLDWFAVAKKNNMKIDIFHIIPIKKNKKIIGYSFSDNTLHDYHDIYPLKRGKFNDFIFNVPNKTIKILNKFYNRTLDIVDSETAYKLKFFTHELLNKNRIKIFKIINKDVKIIN